MRYLMHAILSSFLFTSSIQSSEKDLTWTPEAMMKTKIISDVQISPDNQSILFVVTEPKMIKEKCVALSKIYKKGLSNEGPIPFSAQDFSSTQPRWSPDGEWIAFLSTREGIKNLYLIHADGGEAIALTKNKEDVQTFSWSPDSKKIAFVMSEEIAKPEKTSLAYVYKEKTKINRLWLIDFSSNQNMKPLTSDDYCLRGIGDLGTTNVEFDWSSDSKKIIFAYSPEIDLESFYLNSSLAILDIDTSNVVPIEKKVRYEALPRYSPDGQWIAYLSDNSSHKYSMDRQVAIRSLDGKENRLLAPTYNGGPLLAGPNFLGWTKDSKNLLFYEPYKTKFHLLLLPMDGSSAKEIATELFIKEPALSYDKSMLGFVAQSPSTPPEAFIANIIDLVPRQISHMNDALLAYPKITTEVISWESRDGLQIDGLLTYPLHYEKNKKYPLLLVIHGGPMGFFDESFLGTPNPYPLAAFAQEGFLILRPNPRGSTGYGKNFRWANYQDWGGNDFIDLMKGVDSLIDKGLADPQKLGIMGWSYGGYMTSWAITQTKRFKAASMGAGVTNLVSMNGTSDLESFLTDYLGEFPYQRSLYEDRSPINFVLNVETPCLIQHGTNDLRVPVSQSYEFYHAINRLEKEVVFVLYPEMGHRITDPKMQLDSLKRNVIWFQKHLINSSTTTKPQD